MTLDELTNQYIFNTRVLGPCLIQICSGDRTLITIGEPVGPGNQSKFCIWEGDGMIANTDEEAIPLYTFVRGIHSVEELWPKVMIKAYAYAFKQMGYFDMSFSDGVMV